MYEVHVKMGGTTFPMVPSEEIGDTVRIGDSRMTKEAAEKFKATLQRENPGHDYVIKPV